MAVKYQIDGNIFREITTNWLCAFVNEFLIKARKTDADQAGNTIEYFQLNDGRIFARTMPSFQCAEVSRSPKAGLRNVRSAIREPLSQPR